MREIKYRAWIEEEQRMWYSDSKKQDDMIYFLLINSSGPYLSPVHHEEYDEYTEFELMQYTGLKDKNGKEIYEGDIVKCGNDAPQFVRWNETISGFGMSFKIGATTNIPENCEVIGNIYEHPDLLRA